MPAKITDENWINRRRYNIDENGCWVWNGPKSKDGYGKCSARNGQTLAHRAFYVIIKGELIKGYEIDHLCKNKLCVNPDHMEQVLHSVNISRIIRIKENHRNAKKTHCIRGHEFTPENVVSEVYNGVKMRKCRTCKNARQRAGWLRRK